MTHDSRLKSMKKNIIFITGILLSITFSVRLGYAQNSAPSPCQGTLYNDRFDCLDQKVQSFCLLQPDHSFNLYRQTYCQVSQNSNEAIFKVVADQLGMENSKYNDPKLLQFLLFEIQKSSLEDYLQDRYGNRGAKDQLPSDVQEAFFGSNASKSKQDLIRQRIQVAFNNQKVIHQTKETLKQQFEAREQWANGSLADSPFDLVVTLNQIEKVLFGSQANLKLPQNVWKWPKDDPNNPPLATKPRIPSSSKNNSPTKPAIPNQYECVPKNNSVPNAPNCGNGTKDPGEECDDNNQNSGDGCSSACQIEQGAHLICRDIDAVNFKTFTPSKNSGINSAPAISCPAGTEPRQKPATQIPQDANYSPSLGGILKNLPPSTRPQCPAGSTYAEVQILGISEGRCFRTEFCADFDAARTFLYDTFKNQLPTQNNEPLPNRFIDLPKDHPANAVLGSIEANVCVEIQKVTRPPNPYRSTEGCVDCHMAAMNESMEFLLSKRVAPQKNTMQAFAIRDPLGPSLSFSLNVAPGALKNLVFDPKLTGIEAGKIADQHLLSSSGDLDDSNRTTSSVTLPVTQIITRNASQIDQKNQKLAENLKNYKAATNATAAQNVHTPLIGLFTEFKDSFGRIQQQYTQVITGVQLAEKRQCTF